jgi:hypothetical protein
MQLTVNFVGIEPNEQAPRLGLYSIDARGQAAKVASMKDHEADTGADLTQLGARLARWKRNTRLRW